MTTKKKIVVKKTAADSRPAKGQAVTEITRFVPAVGGVKYGYDVEGFESRVDSLPFGPDWKEQAKAAFLVATQNPAANTATFESLAAVPELRQFIKPMKTVVSGAPAIVAPVPAVSAVSVDPFDGPLKTGTEYYTSQGCQTRIVRNGTQAVLIATDPSGACWLQTYNQGAKGKVWYSKTPFPAALAAQLK